EDEEVERALVLVADLAGQTVDHVELGVAFLTLRLAQQVAGLDVRRQRGAEPEADEDGRIAARKHVAEALAEEQAVQPGRRRDDGRPELAPESRRLTA